MIFASERTKPSFPAAPWWWSYAYSRRPNSVKSLWLGQLEPLSLWRLEKVWGDNNYSKIWSNFVFGEGMHEPFAFAGLSCQSLGILGIIELTSWEHAWFSGPSWLSGLGSRVGASSPFLCVARYVQFSWWKYTHAFFFSRARALSVVRELPLHVLHSRFRRIFLLIENSGLRPLSGLQPWYWHGSFLSSPKHYGIFEYVPDERMLGPSAL